MSGSTEVLREYLLSLGFRVNTQEAKRFDNVTIGVAKRMGALGAATVAVTEASYLMMRSFANNMEKLYYASRRTGSTVENLQSLEFAGRQVGLGAGVMTGSLSRMAMALRSNPGLASVLKGFGIKVEGRDMSDVARDTVRAFSKMPFYVGSQLAAMFGMDPETFLQIAQNQDEMDKAIERRKKMNADLGVDADEAARAMKDWNNELRDSKELIGVMGGALAIALLPTLREATSYFNGIFSAIARVAGVSTAGHNASGMEKMHAWGSLIGSLGFTDGPSGAAPVSGRTKFARGVADFFTDGPARLRAYGNPNSPEAIAKRAEFLGVKPPPAAAAAPAAEDNRQGMTEAQIEEMFSGLEEQYGLQKGVLWSLWSQESGRGKNMRSPTGVVGHFQLTGANRKRLGITDPNNLSQEAVGAAEYLTELNSQYGNRLPNVLAAWNGGTAAGRDLSLGSDETKRFVPSVLSKIEQHNSIVIHGGDAKAIGKSVGQAIDNSNAKHLADLQGAIR